MSRSNATPSSTFKSASNTKSEGTEEDTHAPNHRDPTPVLLPIVDDHARHRRQILKSRAIDRITHEARRR